MIPGELITQPGEIELNPGLPGIRLRVANRGDRPIQVGSHFHFYEVNEALDFVREQTRGMRLDIPAGTAVRFEPGDEREVTLVPLAGSPSGSQSPAEGNPPAALSHRQVYGFNGRINGRLEEQP